MTGQCDFLRKFPNFLRKQGISAHSVYPPLPASPISLPHPSSLNHSSNFNQTEGKGLTDMTAPWFWEKNAQWLETTQITAPRPAPKGTAWQHQHNDCPPSLATALSPAAPWAAPYPGAWEEKREGGSKEGGEPDWSWKEDTLLLGRT